MIHASVLLLSLAQLVYATGRWIWKTRSMLQHRERKVLMDHLDWTRDRRAEQRRRAAAPILSFRGR
jgi:hypothetical protein